jgi:hypothetical protein
MVYITCCLGGGGEDELSPCTDIAKVGSPIGPRMILATQY